MWYNKSGHHGSMVHICDQCLNWGCGECPGQQRETQVRELE